MKRLLAFLFLLIPLPAYATQVQEVTSPGGITAWLVEEHALPLLAVKIVFNGSGFAYDPKGQEGRAGMVSALLMEGAGDMPSKEFNEALENKAIDLNFSIDEDLLRASMESLSEYREQAFSYMSLALTSPRFDDEAIARVRSQALSVLTQQEKQPGYLLQRKWQEVAFGGHPYGQPVLGTKASIAGLEKGDFQNFTRRYLTRGNMIIAVVGDITPQELSRLLDKHLGGLPAQYAPETTLPEVTLPAQAKEEVVSHDIPQTMVMFGAQGVKRDDPGYYTAFVMNQMLGGGGNLTAKLAMEIREKRGLAYSVATMLDPMMRGASWQGGFATRNDQVGAAVGTLRSTLKDFAANGPTDKELADAKSFLTGSFVLGLDSNADIANYLISMQLYHLGSDYFDKRNSYIEAVKKEDVRAMAARLTDPRHLLVVMVGKPNLDTKKQ